MNAEFPFEAQLEAHRQEGFFRPLYLREDFRTACLALGDPDANLLAKTSPDFQEALSGVAAQFVPKLIWGRDLIWSALRTGFKNGPPASFVRQKPLVLADIASADLELTLETLPDLIAALEAERSELLKSAGRQRGRRGSSPADVFAVAKRDGYWMYLHVCEGMSAHAILDHLAKTPETEELDIYLPSHSSISDVLTRLRKAWLQP